MSFADVADHAPSIFQGLGFLDPLIRSVGQELNQTWPNILPAAEVMVRAWRCGNLSDERLVAALLATGSREPKELNAKANQQFEVDTMLSGWKDVWQGVWETDVSIPQTGDLLAACNLGLINDSQFHRIMQRAGYWWEPYRQLELDLSRNRIPDPGELVSFALREAWDQTTVDRFNYDAEFPPEFRYWMEKLGYRSDARIKVDGVAQGNPVSWSQLYWRVHWANISPTQAYEMYQRLRPNRVGRFGADFRNLRPFTFDDLTRVLKVNDYPVPFRDQLAAIAYRLPRLVDIDRFFRSNQIDRSEVLELHLDLGYSPGDAEMRTNWLAAERQKSLLAKSGSNPIKTTVSLYENGLLDRHQAADQLFRQMYAVPPETDVVGRAAWALRAARAETDNDVAALLNASDMRLLLSEAKEVQSAVKRQFLAGYTDQLTAEKNLRDAGFSTGRIARLLQRWNRQLASGHLLLSTAKIRELVVKGILPLDAASGYLANLGWQDRERRYLIAEIQRDWDLEQERITERQSRTERSRTESQARQARLLQAERKRVVKQLNAQSSPAQLKRFTTRGIISFAEYETELQRRGYDARAIKRLLADARIDREKWLRKNRPIEVGSGPTEPDPRQQQQEEGQMP